MVYYPERLVIAVIICLYKKDNINMLEKYRSISFLILFSKLLEKSVSTRLINYFLDNNLFTKTTENRIHNINKFFDAAEVIGEYLSQIDPILRVKL